MLLGTLEQVLFLSRTAREEIDRRVSLILDMKLTAGSKPYLTVPEFAALVGETEREIQRQVDNYRIPSKRSREHGRLIPFEAAENFGKKDDDDEETGRRS